MLFSRRLSLEALIDFCRSMRYALASGRMPHDTMQLLADEGPRRVRGVAGRVAKELKSGWGLQDALQKQQAAFPPLFLALTAVGEESGTLPDILAELEQYYVLRLKLRRDFFSEIMWPFTQFVAAVGIVAGLIYVTGMIANWPGRAATPSDPLGVGLVGKDGAIRFLEIVAGTVVGLAVFWWVVKRLLRRRAIVERLLLRVPLLGKCLQAMVLSRFCLALRFLLAAGLSVRKVMRLAFLASDHPAFVNAYPKTEAALRQGNSIAGSLKAAGVFPRDFLGRVVIAEDSGHLPEALEQQGQELDEFARRRLILLNRLASWFVWLLVAVIIGFTIYRLFNVAYAENMELFLKAP